MAIKKKQQKPKWSVVLFGAFVFMGLGLGCLTAFYAGATAQVRAEGQVTTR